MHLPNYLRHKQTNGVHNVPVPPLQMQQPTSIHVLR